MGSPHNVVTKSNMLVVIGRHTKRKGWMVGLITGNTTKTRGTIKIYRIFLSTAPRHQWTALRPPAFNRQVHTVRNKSRKIWQEGNIQATTINPEVQTDKIRSHVHLRKDLLVLEAIINQIQNHRRRHHCRSSELWRKFSRSLSGSSKLLSLSCNNLLCLLPISSQPWRRVSYYWALDWPIHSDTQSKKSNKLMAHSCVIWYCIWYRTYAMY